MSGHDLKPGELVVKMTGTGIVTNPDGTTHEVVLEATRPLSETEMARLKAAETEGANHGDYPSGCGRNRSD